MRIIYLVLLCSLCFISCEKSRNYDPNAKYLILKNAQIINPVPGTVQQVEMLILKDSLIQYVGDQLAQSELPLGEEIDLENKFLMPPLWDMHFHVSWDKGNDSLLFPLLLSKGIMGLRDMGGDLSILQQMKRKLKDNPEFGPNIWGAGPILDGNPPVMYDFSVALDSSMQIEQILDSLNETGADFFKTYSLLKEEELKRISTYSEANGLSFQGHLSEYIEPEISLELGQKSIEHLNRLDEIWLSDTARLNEIAKLMIKQETWICPTLVIYQKKADMSDTGIIQPDYEAFIHPILKQEWEQSRERRLAGKTEIDWTKAKQLYEQQKALVFFLYKKGVKLLAGSDFAGMPYVYPAMGLWEELALLKEAGIPDKEVLKIAVYHPIQFFGLEKDRGKIEKGFYADFLVLKGNPLNDIRDINSIERVFRHGQQVTNILP